MIVTPRCLTATELVFVVAQIRKRVDALVELDYASEESPGGVVHYVP